jgi:CBS domain-containing protein
MTSSKAMQQGTRIMPTTTIVRDCYTPISNYPHVYEDGNLRDVFATMEVNDQWAEQFRSVLVISAQGCFVGVLSLRDMLQAVLPDYLKNAPSHVQWIHEDITPLALLWQDHFATRCRQVATMSISNFITPVTSTVSLDTPIAKAVFLMANTTANVLPVTDNGQIVGVLRLVDVVTEVAKTILHDEHQ